MAEITNLKEPTDFGPLLESMDDSMLLAQEISQQGAIHAISFLLANGVSEQMANDMLESLRANAEMIRAEGRRRGNLEIFEHDQTVLQDHKNDNRH